MQSSTPEAAPPSSAAALEYEFDANANQVIGSCGNRARIFGIVCAISGVLELIAAIMMAIGWLSGEGEWFLLPAGLFNLVLGVLLTRAGGSMVQVVTTQGRDITLLLEALQRLGSALLIQIVATAVLMLWVLAAIAAFLLLSGKAEQLLPI